MRRPIEFCLAVLVVASGLALFGGGAPSGLSPLSALEARTVIGGADSECPAGEILAVEDPPGTGCDSTCARIPNAFGTTQVGGQVPELTDCPNRCGRFRLAATPCGT